MAPEVWKVVENYPKYEVSTHGRIRKSNNLRILKVQNPKHKYISPIIVNDDGKKAVALHRLIALTFIPNPKNKPYVNHKDRDTRNNNLDNLEWVTGSENMKHMYATGYVKDVKKKWKAILRVDSDGNELRRYDGAKECADECSISIEIVTAIARGHIQPYDRDGLYVNVRYVNTDGDNMENEEWKDITIAPSYEVSSLGRIRNKERTTLVHGKGTRYIRVALAGSKKTYNVHWIVATAFLPTPVSETLVINHKNGNSIDNRVENLEWCTQQENAQHARDVLYDGKINSSHDRVLLQLYMNGSIVKRWSSPRAVRESLGVNCANVCNVCRKYMANLDSHQLGYGWCWEENYDANRKWSTSFTTFYSDHIDAPTSQELEYISTCVRSASKPVHMYTCDGFYMATFDNATAAAARICELHDDAKPSKTSIYRAASEMSFYSGYCWKYASINELLKRSLPQQRVIPSPLTRIFGEIDVTRSFDKMVIEELMSTKVGIITPIWQLSMEYMPIKKWPSASVAQREIGLGRNCIEPAIKHNRACGGFRFKKATIYADDNGR